MVKLTFCQSSRGLWCCNATFLDLPSQAASYEVVFVLLVGACSTMAAVMAVTAATYRILSTDHRLQAEMLLPRADRSIGSAAWFQAEAGQVTCS